MRITPAPSDPDHLQVDHAGRSYRVALRRHPSARKLTLRVAQASGEAVMTLPVTTPIDAAERFASSHVGWIAARMARLPSRVPLDAGSTIPLRGEDHVIVHVAGPRGRTLVARDESGAPSILVMGEAGYVSARVLELLAREARLDLSEAVARHATALGRRARKVAIKDTVSRWGSCTSKGELSFSWRLILAPPFVLDYLAAHEAGHLVEMNHSHRFWKLVRGICPRTDEAESWLKRNGASLHRFG